MHDAAIVRRFEPLGDLPRDRQRLRDRCGAVGEPIGKRRAFDELERQRPAPV